MIAATSAFIALAAPSYAADDSVAAFIQQCRSSARPIAELHAIENGPGIIVCAPVASHGLENAGKGLSAWLNLYVGGNSQCSKTPTLEDQSRGGKEMRHPGLALNLAQADKLAQFTGATDIAVGTLTGSASHCKLQYQVYSISSNHTEGQAITAEGTLSQVVFRLPELAASVLKAVQIIPEGIPTSPNLLASDLTFLSSMDLDVSYPQLTHSDQLRLQSLAKRSLLAAVIWCRTATSNSEEAKAKSIVVSMAPSNALAMASVAQRSKSDVVHYQAIIERNAKRVPDSYLYAAARAWMYVDMKQPIFARNAAEVTVCYAHDNPRAWLTLAGTIGDECNAVRRGATYNGMRADEAAYVDDTYPDWLACCKMVTGIDPNYGLAWLRLSTAACFAGDDSEADYAYWQAATLEPAPQTFWWGLQMYQPKWLGDEGKLARVVILATKASYKTRADAEYVAKALDEVNFSDNATKVRKKYARRK